MADLRGMKVDLSLGGSPALHTDGGTKYSVCVYFNHSELWVSLIKGRVMEIFQVNMIEFNYREGSIS